MKAENIVYALRWAVQQNDWETVATFCLDLLKEAGDPLLASLPDNILFNSEVKLEKDTAVASRVFLHLLLEKALDTLQAAQDETDGPAKEQLRQILTLLTANLVIALTGGGGEQKPPPVARS